MIFVAIVVLGALLLWQLSKPLQCEIQANMVWQVERAVLGSERPPYVFNGGTLDWGKDIPPDKMERLKNGEIFLLYDADHRPFKYILRDWYGDFREIGHTRPFIKTSCLT